MSKKKAIPNGDLDFVTMAEHFARAIAAEPARFEVSQQDADLLSKTVAQFRKSLQGVMFGERSKSATFAKEEARDATVQIVRRLRNGIRASNRIEPAAKILLGIQPRAAKPKTLTCPQEPPRLRFARALHEGGNTSPVHELEFSALDWSARPEGAVRLELFIDLIPPEEKVPAHPAAYSGSRAWYLRSYTRSPIRIVPPLARVPMRVIYWGRWADSAGEVGPFSATAAGWVEGGAISKPAIELSPKKQLPRIELAESTGPADRDPMYRIAVLEMRYQSYLSQQIDSPQLPEPQPSDPKQLEGPEESEAA